MKVSKELLKVSVAADKNDPRDILRYVKVYRDGSEVVSVATNSHVLIEAREPVAEGDTDTGEYLIPADIAKSAHPKLMKTEPHAFVNRGSIAAGSFVKNYTPTAEQYPDYKRIIPTGEPIIEVVFDGALMKKAMEVFKDNKRVVMRVYGANKPTLIESDEDGTKRLVVLGPRS